MIFWILLWLFLLVTGLYPAYGAERKPPVMKLPQQILKEPTVPSGRKVINQALDIRIHPGEGRLTPPGELLLLSPGGKRIGQDPRSGRTYQEIPQAYYEYESIADAKSGAAGPKSGIIYLPNPANGVYRLQVTGRITGKYFLEITAFNQGRPPLKALSRPRQIRKNEIQSYSIRCLFEKGGHLEVTPVKFFPGKQN